MTLKQRWLSFQIKAALLWELVKELPTWLKVVLGLVLILLVAGSAFAGWFIYQAQVNIQPHH